MAALDMLTLVTLLSIITFQQCAGQRALEYWQTINKDVQDEIVDTFNEIRRNVKPPSQNMLKMVWDEDAATTGLIWIRKCQFSFSPVRLRPNNASACGELLYRTAIPYKWSIVINEWYNMQEEFKYGKGERFYKDETGHYSQVVWALSHRVGCQVAFCDVDFMYACSFCPAGNDYSKMSLPYEEGEPCKRCPNDCDDRLCTNPCPHQDSYVNCEELKAGCLSDPIIKAGCKATCQCPTEIK
ncbi:cysteine-rich venom protein-like [Ambystoma mexicanum]|uniref:cysteine-rich venom protein-like n=1 Tax=Ambystoma mexicanum TaxID=8296 RepID=UPI0037E8627E